MKAGAAGHALPEGAWPNGTPAGDTTVSTGAAAPDRSGPGIGRRLTSLLGELAAVLLVLWLVPVAIIVIGAPIAILARALIALAQRF